MVYVLGMVLSLGVLHLLPSAYLSSARPGAKTNEENHREVESVGMERAVRERESGALDVTNSTVLSWEMLPAPLFSETMCNLGVAEYIYYLSVFSSCCGNIASY